MIDCETIFANGCDGGHFEYGMRYAAKIGVRTVKAYPFIGKVSGAFRVSYHSSQCQL